jgi:sugar lactone lactonase YvrE
MVRLAAAASALVLAAVASAGSPAVSLNGRLPGSATVGKAFTVRVTTRMKGTPAIVARGPSTRTFAAKRTAPGRYSASVSLSAPGRWTLSARLRGKLYRLGAVTAKKPAPTVQPIIFSTPAEIAARPDGTLVLAEGGKNRVVRLDAAGGVTPIGGAGGIGTSGDGGLATAANIGNPFGVAVAPNGDVYLTSDQRLRRIDSTGRISTLFVTPTEIGPVTADAHGDVYFAIEAYVYRLDAASGAVSIVAGTGSLGAAGDGGPATAAQVNRPHGLLVAADGALLIGDSNNHAVRRIDPLTKVITTVWRGLDTGGLCAGTGGVYATDFESHTLKRLDAGGTVIVAGNGVNASSGDGKPATQASLSTPIACAVTGDGKVYVVEGGGTGTIRVVVPGGTISTLSRPA